MGKSANHPVRLRNRIETVRRERGLSMDELGARMVPPTSGSVVNKLEKGARRLTIEWMYRIARALECHPNDLLPDPAPSVSRDELVVVEIYRALSEGDRRSAFRMIDAMAKSEEDGPKRGDG